MFSVDIPHFSKYINDVDYFSKSARLNLNSDDLECSDLNWSTNFELITIDENNTKRLMVSSANGSLKEINDYFKILKKGNIIIFHNIKVIAGANEFRVAVIVLEVN